MIMNGHGVILCHSRYGDFLRPTTCRSRYSDGVNRPFGHLFLFLLVYAQRTTAGGTRNALTLWHSIGAACTRLLPRWRALFAFTFAGGGVAFPDPYSVFTLLLRTRPAHGWRYVYPASGPIMQRDTTLPFNTDHTLPTPPTLPPPLGSGLWWTTPTAPPPAPTPHPARLPKHTAPHPCPPPRQPPPTPTHPHTPPPPPGFVGVGWTATPSPPPACCSWHG